MVNIVQDFIPTGRRNRPGHKLTPQYITIHDTANSNAGADALSHAKYLKGDAAAKAPVSWHFTVDDKRVIQHLPLDEVGWHAGDGGNGPGNRTSIGIEICENSDGDRAMAEKNAAEVVAQLLKELGLSIDKVVQHNKWTGKNCPHILRGRSGGWENFLVQVKEFMQETKVSEIDLRAENEHLVKLLNAATRENAELKAKLAEINKLSSL